MKRRLWTAVWLGCAPALALAFPQNAAAPAPAPATAPAAAPAAGAGGTTYAYLSRNGGTFKAPLFAEESQGLPVAQIDAEAITLEELNAAIAGAHASVSKETKVARQDPTVILGRLVDARLLAREAREMGMDELPEFKKALETYREVTAREMLQVRALKGVAADPREVERLYRDAVREYKVRSVLVAKEEDAKRLVGDAKAGKPFDALAKQLVAEKKAKGGDEPQYLAPAKALPQIVAVLAKMKPGAVSAPIKLKDGWAVVKLEDYRYPVDPAARAEAEKTSAAASQKKALEKFYADLVKRHAKKDEALLRSIDYEAKKPGLEALKKDTRVLARIDGAKAITVGELSEAVSTGFYHGVDNKIKEKKLNREKGLVFDGLLSARIVPQEVKRLGIEETPEFKYKLAAYEKSLLFTTFIEKAIVPQLKTDEAAARKYYAEHKKEFTYPTFYKVESLAFSSLKGAEGAVKQLRGGTDFKWLNANADGQVKASERKLGLEGTLAATALPKELATLLAGSKKDDYRLYADEAAKQYYAVHVVDVVGASEQPFEEAKQTIGPGLLQDEVAKSIKDWSEKLRKSRQVTVFLTKIGS